MKEDDVREIFEKSINYCCWRHKSTEVEVDELLKDNDTVMHSDLRYGIAKNLSEYLVVEDDTIKEVYLFGSSQNEEARICSDIDMIFWVDKKTDALEELIDDADKGITEYYISMVGNGAEKMDGIIDAKIINDRDVREKNVWASMINSLYYPATKIWSKEK